MNARLFSVLIALAVFATATTADAAVHRVFPGDDIQQIITDASPGDTILVEPGVYTTNNAQFGLRITTDNLRLIGKARPGQGDDGKVRLVVLRDGDGNRLQETGIYVAPKGCGPELGVGECDAPNLQGFEIRGFTVEDFPRNGIQTRFVSDFKIIRNESARNGGGTDSNGREGNGNGIYPTISANGLVLNNVSYGSKDTAMWVAASENVRVIGNEVYDSVIGLEISVSNEVLVKQNDIHHNTVGVGLFHPNAAGNKPLPVMENWVVQQNYIYDNNRENDAPDGSFQEGLPQGVGVLVLGVSNHVVAKNTVEDNDFVGIAVLGWCTATFPGDPSRNCINNPPLIVPPGEQDPVFYDPSVSNNLVAQNKVRGNGTNPPGGPLVGLAADITFFSQWPVPFPSGPETSSGNCFEKNKPSGFTSVSSDGELPTDGC